MTEHTKETTFMGIERSVTGKWWRERATDERLATTISQRFGVPEIVGRVMANRGIGLDDAESFLSPTLRDLMPDPSSLRDMDMAASRIADAIEKREQMAVFGDYDVDGATSTALLKRFFRALGADVPVHIPDRMTEGYGPNAPALLELQRKGANLILTVDCGVTAYGPLQEARDAGIEVIVVDHHAAEPELPPAVAVVNPNRLDDESGLGHLCAAGVAFLLCVAILRELRSRGWLEKAGVRAPDLRNWLDLVALGTVCDVVPLRGLNRAFVTQGLKVMKHRSNIGMTSLADIAGVNETPSAYHLGYVLGPRVNAGGRVGESFLGTTLLSGDNPAQAQDIARKLDEYNRERKAIEDIVLDQAISAVEGRSKVGSMVLVGGEDWHPGVIGIVASRLKDRYHVPSLVMGLVDGVYKGSGRSVRGIDLGAAIIAARQAGLLINGGGHGMAAGFTLDPEKQDAFESFLEERFAKIIEENDIRPTITVDGALHAHGATIELIDALEKLDPFGAGNAEPRFAFVDCRAVKADVVGADHVRCILTGANGKGRLKAIAFRCLDNDMGQTLIKHGGRPLHVLGHLRRDTWQGRDGVQLIIDDVSLPV
ncbi:single-stranded-DNA-specific exonuclease RecJ [Thalassospira sp. GO-4]|jgi:single-stranded-DNA-specific exonuclease|uniref:single-stranded-DNA-specific exonuclease RecJ n=1 Tax=Thalassospira sp. GO-4 TaxID=2946605 RepID=UPI0020241FDD|nr:single-stranded-DNA-specific exonuclease RecJ [Thalassospira sp. GO-4]URK18404.1 single-stranded-DNA-specific exonuclease RecJ [Thalassospira sp. GO-4]